MAERSATVVEIGANVAVAVNVVEHQIQESLLDGKVSGRNEK